MATLAQLRRRKPNARPRVALVGIGQELRGDDAVGVILARTLLDKLGAKGSPAEGNSTGLPLQVIDGGAAPENCTGALRRFRPDLVILIDAAQMDQAPGAVQWLDCEHLSGFSASTHTLPLDILAHYLQAELGCQVALLGIQPADTSFDVPLSPRVWQVMSEIVETFHCISLSTYPIESV